MILDSKNVQYEVIDIAEPGKEADKEFMQEKSTNKGGTTSDGDPRHALPPQIFSDDEYCGKYGNNFLLNYSSKPLPLRLIDSTDTDLPPPIVRSRRVR